MDNQAAHKTGQEEFFILDQQNEGIEIPLFRPDGSKSKHWLRIRGVFSDEFQKARRQLLSVSQAEMAKDMNDETREKFLLEKRLELTAVLIMAWSFDMDCTPENKVEFLRKAPQILQMVDKVSSDQALFTRGSSRSSKSGFSSKSSSSSRQRGRKSR